MRILKKRIATAATILGIAAAGAAFAYHNFGHNGEHEAAKFEPTLALNGTEIVVRAFRIESDSQMQGSTNGFTGTLEPRYQTQIGFRVAGKIASRHVEVGDRVRAGDVLFRLDPTDYDLQLRVAESELVSAKSLIAQTFAEEQRLRNLRTTGAVSQSEYDLGLASRDVAAARVDSAEKRLELAKNQRDYCELKADTNGLIVSISGEAGQVVNIGQSIAQIAKGTELEAVVNIPENRVSDIKSLSSRIRFWSHPDLEIASELRELSPIADPISRTYAARFRLLSDSPLLSIGMTATVHLSAYEAAGVCIPITSITNQGDRASVWKIDDTGSVSACPVDVVQYRDNTVIVRGPLHAGDQIVSAGVQRVDENVRVRVWNAK
jgi:RND family efflux transporter MFP subunit